MHSLFTRIVILILFWGCGPSNPESNSIKTQESSIPNRQVETNYLTTTHVEPKRERWLEPKSIDTTLNFNDNIQVSIKNTDSIYISEYFMDQKTQDSIYKHFNNSHLAALAVENFLSKNNEGLTKRDSNGLSIKLKNGDWKSMSVNPNTDEADHTFEHFFKELGYYSLRVQWGEGNGYKLVNYSNGREFDLFGRPYFSQNGQYIISVNTDLEAQYSANGFQLFENKNDSIKLLGDFNPGMWGPTSAMWTGKNKLIMRCETIESNNDEMKYLEFYSELNFIKR